MRILSVYEKTPRKQDKRLVISVSSNTEFLLECVFTILPGVTDKSEFISALAIHMPIWKNMLLPSEACPGDFKLYSGNLS